MVMGERKTWPEICQINEYHGLWLALDHCRYDQTTLQPIEGQVVDADEDLTSLCTRMRSSGQASCAIRFCDAEALEVLPPRSSARYAEAR
jgi:hypothetical protein